MDGTIEKGLAAGFCRWIENWEWWQFGVDWHKYA